MGADAADRLAEKRKGPPLVAIVGRANVGKSTLVNRMVGRREAIEHPEPGVTRDPRGYPVDWDGTSFTIVDTGGWEPRARGLSAKVVAQAERAAKAADLIVFVVDATTGATADDLAVARSLKRGSVPVIVAANKVDDAPAERETHALERLGLGPAFPVSALHGRGSGDLLDVIAEHVRGIEPGEAPHDESDAINVALVGRPNVGKSSLFNRLVSDERSIVDDAPGTTRDAVDTVVVVDGTPFRFVDTAGIRRKVKHASGPEYYGLVRSLRAIDDADVAVLMIDASEGPTEQDQKIAQRISDAGRAAVVVLNKWDLVEEEKQKWLEREVEELLHFVSWAPMVRTSALTGRGVGKLLPVVRQARAAWEKRVPTAQLNAWLREVAGRIPLGGGQRPVRLKYVTQARTKPPEIVLFASGKISPQATRGLERRLRERFGFEGTSMRVVVRVQSGRSGDKRKR